MRRHQVEPFFVNLHYYAPHRPSVSRKEKWNDHYLTKEGDPVTGQGLAPAKKKKEIAAYATMIQSLDENIKRITDYLDLAGLRENTILIFTSDNGFNGLQSRNNLLRGSKGEIYEGGIRVPALFNWPKTIAPRRSKEPIQGLDYFPTFLELAGLTNSSGTLDGDSLVPIFHGKTAHKRPLFWHLASTYKHPPCSVIRKGDWKLIQFLNSGKVELYNLREDLKESQNLATKNAEQAETLLKELVQWRLTHQVPLPPSSPLEH